MSDLGKGDAADFGEIPKGLKGIAALARKFGLRITSGATGGHHHYRQSAIWPEVRSNDHYDHHGPRGSYHQPPPSRGLWQTPPLPRLESAFYDPIEMAQRYMRMRYGDPRLPDEESEACCPHFTPAGIECPWCEP